MCYKYCSNWKEWNKQVIEYLWNQTKFPNTVITFGNQSNISNITDSWIETSNTMIPRNTNMVVGNSRSSVTQICETVRIDNAVDCREVSQQNFKNDISNGILQDSDTTDDQDVLDIECTNSWDTENDLNNRRMVVQPTYVTNSIRTGADTNFSEETSNNATCNMSVQTKQLNNCTKEIPFGVMHVPKVR